MPHSLAYSPSRHPKKKTLAASRFIEKSGEVLKPRIAARESNR